MFHTYPEAELPLPPGLAPHGERSWHWIEFGLHLPYFMASLVANTSDGPFGRTIIFSSFQDLQGLLAQTNEDLQLRKVALLSPPWMNGSENFALDELKQVWSDEYFHDMMFVLADGRRYWQSMSQEQPGTEGDTSGMRLVMAI